MNDAPPSVAWDAEAYERLADAQFRWAMEVVAWRTWRGDERVLDAGCGPGKVAQEMLQRWPQLAVIALDRDPDMLDKARRRLAPFGPRAKVLEGDLGNLPDLGPVDVVLSTAVLHWVPDHDAAFRGFHGSMRPGGDLLMQCGGRRNIATLVDVAGNVKDSPAFQARFRGWKPPWHFEGATETANRLRQAGFTDVKTSLEPKPTPFAGRDAFLAFCSTAPLRPYLGMLSAEERPGFVAAVGDAWEARGLAWELDYVRLNARAVKARQTKSKGTAAPGA